MLVRLIPALCMTLALGSAATSAQHGGHQPRPKPAKAKPAATRTVALQVQGLHCPPCADAVRSALARAKGVKKAQVSFEKKHATVTYDPKATTVTRIIQVVRGTPHMMGEQMKYDARVHGGHH